MYIDIMLVTKKKVGKMFNIKEINTMIEMLEQKKEEIREKVSSECPKIKWGLTCLHNKKEEFTASVWNREEKINCTVKTDKIETEGNINNNMIEDLKIIQKYVIEKTKPFYKK
jgi:hypothetical protein